MWPWLITVSLAIGAIVAAIIAFHNLGQAIEWFHGKYVAWRARPKKAKRLGLYDHDERISVVWRNLNLARNEEYKALAWIGPMGKMLPPVGKPHDRNALKRLRWHMWGRVGRLERAARRLTVVADDILQGFHATCKGPDREVTTKTLSLFVEDSPTVLKGKLRDDIAIFKHEWAAAIVFLGNYAALDRQMNRYREAINKIVGASFGLIEMCEQAEAQQEQEQPQPVSVEV
jgi:hypothetical protein